MWTMGAEAIGPRFKVQSGIESGWINLKNYFPKILANTPLF